MPPEVERVKLHKETRLEYMTLMMELKEQWREGHEKGREEGREEGRSENILKNVRSLMAKKGWSLDEALDVLDVSPEDRAVVMAKM